MCDTESSRAAEKAHKSPGAVSDVVAIIGLDQVISEPKKEESDPVTSEAVQCSTTATLCPVENGQKCWNATETETKVEMKPTPNSGSDARRRRCFISMIGAECMDKR